MVSFAVGLRVPNKQIRDLFTFKVSIVWKRHLKKLRHGCKIHLQNYGSSKTFLLRINFPSLNSTELCHCRVTSIILLPSNQFSLVPFINLV
jgi:hypothetical protein